MCVAEAGDSMSGHAVDILTPLIVGDDRAFAGYEGQPSCRYQAKAVRAFSF
jgi:hypothetical protein